MLSPERRAEIRRNAQSRMLAELSGITEFVDPTLMKPHGVPKKKDMPLDPRLAEIGRLALAKDLTVDMSTIAPGIVTDFLAGVGRKAIAAKYKVTLREVARHVIEGTTREQQHEVWKSHQRRRAKASCQRKRIGVVSRKPPPIPVGPYPSISKAARAAGIHPASARKKLLRGVPWEQWGKVG